MKIHTLKISTLSKLRVKAKSLYLFMALTCISPSAIAHGIPDEVFIIGFGIYILPIFLGVWLVGKGNRLWFSAMSLIVYVMGIFIGFMFSELVALSVTLFSPYVLLIIAWVKRKQTKA